MCKSTLEVHAGWAGHVCAAQHGRGPYARRDVSSSMRQFFGDDYLFSLGFCGGDRIATPRFASGNGAQFVWAWRRHGHCLSSLLPRCHGAMYVCMWPCVIERSHLPLGMAS